MRARSRPRAKAKSKAKSKDSHRSIRGCPRGRGTAAEGENSGHALCVRRRRAADRPRRWAFSRSKKVDRAGRDTPAILGLPSDRVESVMAEWTVASKLAIRRSGRAALLFGGI